MRNHEINNGNYRSRITVRRENVMKNMEINNDKLEKGIESKVPGKYIQSPIKDVSDKIGKKIESKVPGKYIQSPIKEVSEEKYQRNTYEDLSKNPFIWPKSSEIVEKEQKQLVLDNLIARREIIRMHFKDDVVNGVPNWFPTRKQFNSEFVNAEYLANIIDFLSESDVSIDPIGRNFLEGSSKITFRDRYVFINWLVLTHSQFSMCSDTLYLAISLSDRFIKANKETLIATDLIIIGIVCLFMAAKIEEIWIPTINDLLSLWNLEYTKEFCSELEIQILCAVNFQLSLPVPISFIRHYSILFSSNNLSQFLSRYFCELSLQDSEACCQSCSLIGASCVFLSEVISRNITSDFSVVWTPKLQASSGLVYADFQNLVKNLCIIVQKQATSSNLRAITQKYSCVGYMNAPNEALSSKAFRSIFLHFRNQIQANQ